LNWKYFFNLATLEDDCIILELGLNESALTGMDIYELNGLLRSNSVDKERAADIRKKRRMLKNRFINRV
jgi:hypothetical protein